MSSFRTIDDLTASLKAAGLSSVAGAIAATARPVILFLRIQAPDDPLSIGASKMGGLPDLPENFVWPMRGPYPDAERRAAEAIDFAHKTAAAWEAQAMGPVEAHQRVIPRAQIDRLAPAAEARGRAAKSAFPLGFVGQINLAALAGEPGLDPDLPRSGLLSVFEDVTGEGLAETPTLFFHDAPADALKRTAPPRELIEHVDLCGSYGLGAEEPWSALTMAETLVPFSAVAAPYRWTSAFPRDSPTWRKVWDWFHAATDAYAPAAPSFEGHGEAAPQAGNFGDRLGGWPDPIQGDPEAELGEPVVTPGKTRLRQVFAYGGEFYGGTRRMASDGKGDGTTYLLIDRDALAARKFEAARWTYQID